MRLFGRVRVEMWAWNENTRKLCDAQKRAYHPSSHPYYRILRNRENKFRNCKLIPWPKKP